MSEAYIQFVGLIRTVILGMCMLLYALGGMCGTWWRRYVMPVCLALGILVVTAMLGTMEWHKFLWPVFLSIAFHIGYGGTTTIEKVVKRTFAGYCIGISAYPLLNASNVIAFNFHVILCMCAMVAFGVWNPFKHAREEETVLGCIAILIPMFMV